MLSTKPPVRPVQAAEAEGGTLPELSITPSLSTEGYFVLNWSGGAAALVLQRSTDPDFRSPEQRPLPPGGALTLTGFTDGLYYFRAGAGDGRWSETARVEVRHHELGRALAFFFLGLGLFLILCLAILLGHRRSLEADHA